MWKNEYIDIRLDLFFYLLILIYVSWALKILVKVALRGLEKAMIHVTEPKLTSSRSMS
jgi:hypothetical protein